MFPALQQENEVSGLQAPQLSLARSILATSTALQPGRALHAARAPTKRALHATVRGLRAASAGARTLGPAMWAATKAGNTALTDHWKNGAPPQMADGLRRKRGAFKRRQW